MAAKAKTDFFFEGNVAGYFEESPSSPGQFSYMPYRGIGHYRLTQALASGPQRCYYIAAGEKQHFTVERLLGNGILEISETSR